MCVAPLPCASALCANVLAADDGPTCRSSIVLSCMCPEITFLPASKDHPNAQRHQSLHTTLSHLLRVAAAPLRAVVPHAVLDHVLQVG